jgi:hypothetical protein
MSEPREGGACLAVAVIAPEPQSVGARRRRRTELSILVVAETACQRAIGGSAPCATVPDSVRGRGHRFRHVPSVSPPSFPQLWKTLWKTHGPAEFRCQSREFRAVSCRRRGWIAHFSGPTSRPDAFVAALRASSEAKVPNIDVFRVISHGNEHLGPDPLANRNEG